MHGLEIRSLWNGEAAEPGEYVRLELSLDASRLEVRVDAPFHDDPAPPAVAGRLDRLWEYEVVELFLVGSDGSYVELEFGPHGHWLALDLEGIRRIRDDRLALDYRVTVGGERWKATAALAASRLPRPLSRWNAFAIHGAGKRRRHLAASALPGGAPDFHQPERFPGWPPASGG